MLADPNIALLLATLGLLAIFAELCRPGLIVPGIAGGVALLVGIASLLQAGPPSLEWAAAILTPVLMASLWLGRIALRARRNKRTT